MGGQARCAIGVGVAVAMGFSQGAFAQCVTAKPPPALFSTILNSPAFRPREILDPLLQLRIDPTLAAAARYRIEYFDPVDPKAEAPTATVDVDPVNLQLLEEKTSGSKFLDLRSVPLLDGYRQARVVLDVPALDVRKPVFKAAAFVRALANLDLKRFAPKPAYGGQVTVVALSEGGSAASAHFSPGEAGRLQDALVLIVSRTPDGEMLCNGTLIGDGRVLTAGHCLSKTMSVLMGRVWARSGDTFGAEFSCPGKASASQTAIRDALGLPMDIGIVELPPGFGASAGGARFAGASLPVSRPAVAPRSFRMAATWTGDRQPIGFTPDRAVYAPDYLAKQFFQPPAGGGMPEHSWCQAPPATERKACLEKGPLSKDGWRHRCPSVGGLSGAPLFDGEGRDLAVIAVNTGEGARPDNCATAASALPALE